MKPLRPELFDPQTGERLPSLADNPDDVDPEADAADRAFGAQLNEQFVASQIDKMRKSYGARYSKPPMLERPAPEPPPMPAPAPEMRRLTEPLLGEPPRPPRCPPPVWSPARGLWTPVWAYRLANEYEQRARDRASKGLDPRGTDTAEPYNPSAPLPRLR
jgi:hypothetical protein